MQHTPTTATVPSNLSFTLNISYSDANGMGARFANPTAAQIAANVLGIKYEVLERQVCNFLICTCNIMYARSCLYPPPVSACFLRISRIEILSPISVIVYRYHLVIMCCKSMHFNCRYSLLQTRCVFYKILSS